MRFSLIVTRAVLGVLVAGLLALPPMTLAQFPPGPGGTQAPDSVPRRYVVALDVDALPESLLADPSAVAAQREDIRTATAVLAYTLATTTDADLLARFQTIPYAVVEAGERALAQLANAPFVRGIFEDIPVPPADALPAPSATALTNAQVGVEAAWALGYDGAGQVVAIIDTGVDREHPALAGRVVYEGCFTSFNCPNGERSQTGPGAAAPAPGCVDCDHGTHVSGIAVGNDGGFRGVAPGAGLIMMNTFSLFSGGVCGSSPSPCPLSFPSDQALALEQLYLLRTDYAIASVNMSLGSSTTYSTPCDASINPALLAAAQTLRGAGIPVVAAAGNSSQINGLSAPACATPFISVGAVTTTDALLSFSNSAPFLDLLAPGSSIESSVPGGGYAVKSGTSMASPYISATWALMRQAYPRLTLDEILLRVSTLGKGVVDPRNGRTFPRLQVDALMREAQGFPFVETGLDSAFATSNDFFLTLDAQAIAQEVTHRLDPKWAVFVGRDIEVGAAVGPVDLIITVSLRSEDGLFTFRISGLRGFDGSAISAGDSATVYQVMPGLLLATFDVLVGQRFLPGFDVDIIYVDEFGLLQIYGTQP